MTVIGEAHPNIALVKYWGKRPGPEGDHRLNLPAVGSLSVTLDGLLTRTQAHFIDGPTDRVFIGGEAVGGETLRRVVDMIDAFRLRAQSLKRVEIQSVNTFPTAVGLASSASGFAALGIALRELWSVPLTLQGLSGVVRVGSGSASRSLHGGWVEWQRGVEGDGSDSIAVPLAPPSWWDVQVVVAVLNRGRKAVGSREGMQRSVETSPMFQAFAEHQEADLAHARDALQRRDLPALGAIVEASCLKMVSTWLTARPPLHYWQPETLEVIQAVTQWREKEGLGVWFTTDAGPQVKVICAGEDAAEVAERLGQLEPVLDVMACSVGGPATVRRA